MKKGKKLMAIVLSAVMAGSFGSFNVRAQEQDTLTMPVQFYDYDADGLFYEYALYNGMDTFGLGESNNEGVTKDLVESKLGDDGLPVYTRDAVESAAQTIHTNLLTQKTNADVTKFPIFNSFANTVAASGTFYDTAQVLGDASSYFHNRWDLENVVQSKEKNGEIYTGEGTVWKQESDGVLNYGVSDHLTKTVKIEKGISYIFSYYNDGYDSGKLKYEIKDANGKVLLDNKVSGSTFTSETDEVTIDIYSNPNAEFDKAYKFAIPRLRPETLPEGKTEDDYGYLLGNTTENTNFITEGWTSEKYNSEVNKENAEIVDGETYWKQVGNGVACLKDSSIVMDTDIPANQYVNIYYFLGYDGYNADGITIDLLDSKNKLLAHNALKDETGGEYVLTADASDGEGNIKVRINGKAGSRIAAVKLTPMGNVLPEGDYEATVKKYNAGNLNKVEDCTTCMDYAYLRLKNFYNTSFYLNKKDNTYNTMILKSNIKEDGKVEYTFDSSKEVTYNDDGSFYNAASDKDVSGFFPLDHTGEKFSDGNTEDPQEHNYHFGMKVDGDFIYKQGADQFFNFSGDDDVYVFINGELAVDLGGAHKEAGAQLDIEQYAADHNIKNGEKCKFQMFYLERHTTASNCKIQTNLSIGNHAEYKFESKTEGMNLPDAVIKQTPIDENEYYNGQTVYNIANTKKYDDVYDTENKGVWKFVNWDKESQKNEKSDVQFTGYWEFVKDDFKTTNEFISGTPGRTLPEEITKLLPAGKEHLVKNDKVDADTSFTKEVVVSDGKWTFTGWDKDSVTIDNKDEVFTGTWVFTPNVVNDQVNQNTSTPSTSDQTTSDSSNTKKKPSYDDENNKDNGENSSNEDENGSEDTTLYDGNRHKNNSQQSSSARTGDQATPAIYLGMFTVAALGIVFLLRKRIRRD